MISTDNRKPNFLTAVFLVIAGLLALWTVPDYGLSWDEVFRTNGGEEKLDYYRALFAGDSEVAAELRKEGDRYPGLFDLSLAVLRNISPMDEVTTGHLWTASFGLLGLLGTVLLGRLVGGPWVGLIAGLLLAICPRYWGHMFINPKDIPFAATFVFGLWAFFRGCSFAEGPKLGSALWFGLAAGACMAVRIGGLLLFCYAGLFFGVWVLWQGYRERWSVEQIARTGVRRLTWIGVAALVAFPILFIFWPNIHSNPFVTVGSTLEGVTNFGWEGFVLFRGELLPSAQIPWTYLPVWLLIGLPEIWLLIPIIGLGVLLRNLKQQGFTAAISGKHAGSLMVLAFVVLFPPLYIIFKGSTVYDGFRHILFILPPLAVLLSLIGASILRATTNRSRWLLWISAVAVGLLMPLLQQFRLHPYQYIYFNYPALILEDASENFDTDYWGTAYREATDRFVEWAYKNDAVKEGEPVRLAMIPPYERIFERFGKVVVPPPALVQVFLPQGFQLVHPTQNPDFYLAITRNGFSEMLPGETIIEIKRAGVLLARVTDSRPE